MTLILASGPAVDADPFVTVELDDQGQLVVTIETETTSDTLTLGCSSVMPNVKALADAPGREQAA